MADEENKPQTDLKPQVPSNEDVMTLVRNQARTIAALEARLSQTESISEGKVEFYACNACGVRLDEGEKCETHPNEQVNGNGRALDRVGRPSYGLVSQR